MFQRIPRTQHLRTAQAGDFCRAREDPDRPDLAGHRRLDRKSSGRFNDRRRPVGRSEGDWRTACFDALAGDAAAAFVIDVVGSLVVMEQQLYHELENAYREHGLDDETIDYLQGLAQFSFEYLRDPQDAAAWQRYSERRAEIAGGPVAGARGDPYWVFWPQIHDYDPLPYWREPGFECDVPCLVLCGELDEHENVPVAASLARARELIADPDFSIEVYEGSGHGLFTPGTTILRPDMLDDATRWIRRATAERRDR